MNMNMNMNMNINTKQIDLSTTCFSYPYKDGGNVVFGSDEGKLYKAEIYQSSTNLSSNSNSNELFVKDSIHAHFGPITNIDFNPSFFHFNTSIIMLTKLRRFVENKIDLCQNHINIMFFDLGQIEVEQ